MLLKQLFNRSLHLLARFAPGAQTVRPFLHRLRGVQIHGRVFIGEEVYLENEYPESVEIHDQVTIGLRSTIIAHTRGHGKIILKEKVVLGAGCLIVCAAGQELIIGAGSVISAGSVVSRSVAPGMLCSGPKAEEIAEVTVPLTPEVSYKKFVLGLRPLRKRS